MVIQPPLQTEMSVALRCLRFVSVRTHAEMTRLLHLLRLGDQLLLTLEHFTALPAIVRATDLAAIVPRAIDLLFPQQDFALIEPHLPMNDYIWRDVLELSL